MSTPSCKFAAGVAILMFVVFFSFVVVTAHENSYRMEGKLNTIGCVVLFYTKDEVNNMQRKIRGRCVTAVLNEIIHMVYFEGSLGALTCAQFVFECVHSMWCMRVIHPNIAD